MKIKFTEIFTDLFLETGLTKTKFAKEINIGNCKIQHYLDGEIPSPKTVAKICDYFKCSMDYITGLTNEFCYDNIKQGYFSTSFMPEYQHLLKLNSTNHFSLSKRNIVNESSLNFWKKGHLPQFEVIFKIAYELGGSIDKMLGRI